MSRFHGGQKIRYVEGGKFLYYIIYCFLLPASLMTPWNSQFLHTLTHGQGWVGGVGMMTFLALAHMWHATQVMGRVGWVGWGWWRFYHLHTCDMLRTWRFLHLHTCDMLRKSWGGLGGWGGDDDVSITCTHVTCYALDVSCTCTHVTCYASHGEGWVGGVGMMTFLSLAHMWHATHLTFLALAHMWHFKTRLTGTQALDKVWSHLKKHVPKSRCSRSKSDRRFNPRMEQYVYSYMWRFNNRNWWKQLGQLCQQHWQKEKTSANEVFFFFRGFLLPNLKSQKLSSAPSFGGFFYTSVKIQNRKKRGN